MLRTVSIAAARIALRASARVLAANARGSEQQLLKGQAAFGGWQQGKPGVRRLFTLQDLPPIGESTPSFSEVVPGPAGAKPRVPAELVTSGLAEPCAIRTAPNAYRLVADSSNLVRVFRVPAGSANPARDAVFAGGLYQPFGNTTCPLEPNPDWVYIANSVVRFPNRNGDLTASGKPEREAVRATIVRLAPHYDLAVIRLSDMRDLRQPIAVGSSAELKVGRAAFAIGNPFGLDQSLTSGIISSLKRRLPASGGREIGNVIETDAAINPGNSGGPLLDSAGRLIGVNTAIFSPSGSNAGIGYAIPVDVVNRVVPELIRNGRVPAPGIGIVAASKTIATRLGVEGVIVVRTTPGSPAARAGLHGVDSSTGELGDIIVAANGRPVRGVADLAEEVEQTGVGKTIELTLKHDSNKISKKVEVTDVEIQATPAGVGIL
jgi:2-alkenal reductase